MLVGYERVIQYRDRLGPWSESCPIYWRTDKFKLVDSGHFWLSETPDKMSRGWDAAINRVTTWVVLEERGGECRRFAVFNTHFDHQGDEARLRSVDVVFEQIEKINSITDGTPIIFMGDLNFSPTGFDGEPYRLITEHYGLLDAATETDPPNLMGTFNRWGVSRGGRIDYIFFSSEGFEVVSYKVDTREINGTPPSDHDAVVAVLRLVG
jgi:endonuclease/exonuclease/phosphatase family metal-dependent hydrolase